MQGTRAVNLLLSYILILSVSAQFNGPESVEYDPVGDRYFVSNTGSSAIVELDQQGNAEVFVTGLPNAPYGLEIMGDVLYACMGSGVRGYSLQTGEEVYYRNLNAQFPNGITTDRTFLYITAFQGQNIIKVDPINDSHETLVASTGGQPNGIVYDPNGERLVVAFWGSNAPIKSFDRNTGVATTLVANTGLSNIDGITIDCLGRFITASWSPDQLTAWDPAFTSPGVDLGAAGLNNPADIDFDPVNNVIAVPNTAAQTVTFHEVACTIGVDETITQKEQLMVIPNPVRDLMHIQPAFKEPQPYIILDQRGLLIGGGTLRPNGLIDLRRLSPGTYILNFTAAHMQVRLVKE